MKNYELKQFPNADSLARAAAKDWLDFPGLSSGNHSVAFSGGRIARIFFSTVAELAKSSNKSLQNVDFFWADERCVPPDDPESNFLLAKKNLFDPMAIAPDKIHRLKGELPPADAVAEANAAILRIAPTLDLIFLGLGENAHIASLMPNIPEATANAKSPYVKIENSPKPPPNRISLSYAAMAAARNVWMLASGTGKEAALRQSLEANSKTPFGRVLQSRAHTLIYSDIAL